jgi:hypothetical protein
LATEQRSTRPQGRESRQNFKRDDEDNDSSGRAAVKTPRVTRRTGSRTRFGEGVSRKDRGRITRKGDGRCDETLEERKVTKGPGPGYAGGNGLTRGPSP